MFFGCVALRQKTFVIDAASRQFYCFFAFFTVKIVAVYAVVQPVGSADVGVFDFQDSARREKRLEVPEDGGAVRADRGFSPGPVNFTRCHGPYGRG